MDIYDITISFVIFMVASFVVRYLASKDIMGDGTTLKISKKMAIIIGLGSWIAYILMHLSYAVFKG